jgi:hypothetical protein
MLSPAKTMVLVGFGILVAIMGGLYFVLNKTKQDIEDNTMRPYASPNRLIIAQVRSDYGSSANPDGSLLLRKSPNGSALGLAAWWGGRGAPASLTMEELLSGVNGTYTPLETPSEPCRTDADPDTLRMTYGELTLGDQHVLLSTCTFTKKTHTYFLAWAAQASDLENDKEGLRRMLKASQLVDDKLCALNVINAGCTPSATALVTSIITNTQK